MGKNYKAQSTPKRKYISFSFKQLLFSMGALAVLSGCSSEKDCSSFHEGEYSYTKDSDVRILRTGNVQKEYSLTDDWMEVTEIHWTDDCSYYLTLKSTTHPDGTTFKQGDTMWVEITATDGDRYEFSAALGDQVYNNTMIKID